MKGVSNLAKALKLEKPADKPKFRYHCDACSNDAFFSDKKDVMAQRTCKHCGKPILTKLENYLLNDR